MKFIVLLCLIAAIFAENYFQEDFSKPNWESRWLDSKTRDNLGKFVLSAGKFQGSKSELSQGLQTSQDAKFYGISTKFQKQTPELFSKDLFIQYSVKHEQGIDCGGGYLKLFQAEDLTDLTKLEEKSKYAIMFGPDICGADKKVHLIFESQGKNLLWKKKPECKSDKQTHVYTLHLIGGEDKKYSVLIDGKQIESGKLEDDWEFLPPKQIRDPAAKKPADWVDEPMMADPMDKKPADWEEEPKMIADINAKKPEDWDDVEDGKWEAPKIQNPKYKGDWKAKMISNPNYKGPWEAPMIDNPEFKADASIGHYKNLNAVAVEIWQVKSGSIFGNFLVTDDESVQKEQLEKIMKNAEEEKKKLDEEEDKKRKQEEEERKKREEEEKKKREEEEKKKKEEEEKKKSENVAKEIKLESEEKKAAPAKKDEL